MIVVLSTASQAADWPFYRKDLAGTANAGEPLTLDQARALEVTRMGFLSGSVFSNPIVANGNLYFTSGDGYLHAVALGTYTQQWKKAVYATGPFHCLSAGREPPVGAPAVVGSTVFVPGGDGVVYSLDASGKQNWATRIADVGNLGEFLWSSIFPLNGKLYIGVSSLHDCLLVPGRVVALDQATGAVVGTWWGDASHGPGVGVWTQPAYDAVSNRLFFTTGTIALGKTSTQQPWADAFVAIDPDTMLTLDAFSPVPADTYYDDFDFGASPTLYDSPAGRHFIAATNKNGWVYALDRDKLANGIVWKYQISGPGTSPDFGESSIVSAPYANGTLFVGGGTTADGTHPGAIAALDAFTGAQKWIFYPEGFVLGAMTVTGDVLFAATTNATTGRGKLYALDQATGTVLYQLTNAGMFGEPTWANDALYAGDGVGVMYELKPNRQGPQPDFDLGIDRLTTLTAAGGTATASVYAVPKNGFNGPVSLTVTTTVATPSLNPSTLTPTASTGQAPYTSTLSLATSPTGGTNYQTVVVTGTGGGRTRSTALWLVISDFALSATTASAIQGSSASSTVKISPKQGFASPVTLGVSGLPAGTTASFDPAIASTTSTLTFQTSSATPPGTYQVQVSGATGALTHTTPVQLVVTDFELSATAASAMKGSSATSTVTVSPKQGFAGPVALGVSGLPPGTTASFDLTLASTSSRLTFQTSSATPAGNYQVQVSGAAGALIHATPAQLVVTDFDLRATPVSTIQGTTATSTVTVASNPVITTPVRLSVSGLPAGMTAAFDPVLATTTSTLTLQSTSATPPGTYQLQVSGTEGVLTRTIALPLAVRVAPKIVPASSGTGCGSGGQAGLGTALLGLFLAACMSRRRWVAKPA